MSRNDDIDSDRTSIVSLPEGLKEECRFLPNIELPVCQFSSCDDIARFYRYFHLIQRQRGKAFKWRYYQKILQDGLKNFRIPTNQKKILPNSVMSSVSDISSYKTARKFFSPQENTILGRRCRDGKVLGSPNTATSTPLPLNVGTQVLKVCKETKNLARSIYRKVEKISNLKIGSPRDQSKQKKYQVRTISGTGDTFITSSPISWKGESSDTEVDVLSLSPASSGAGDRKRRRFRKF